MTKKHINRKDVLHFRLVQKSVKDCVSSGDHSDVPRAFAPLNKASAQYLAELEAQPSKVLELHANNEDLDNLPELEEQDHPVSGAGEAAKYGIYFDDRTYDYTKHLKSMGEDPSAVFISAGGAEGNDQVVREECGLSTEAYAEDLDPAVQECLEALDDEDFVDDEFADDFVVKLDREEVGVLCPMVNPARPKFASSRDHRQIAKGAAPRSESDDSEQDDSCCDVESLKGISHAASLAITHIDSKFDALMKIYDSEEDDDDDRLDEVDLDEYGANDSDDHGAMELQEALEDFLLRQRDYIPPSVEERKQGAVAFLDEIRKEMGTIPDVVLDRENISEDGDDLDFRSSSESDHFDCQSIIVTLSHSENLPAVIREDRTVRKADCAAPKIIRISRRTGLPIVEDVRGTGGEVVEDDTLIRENKGLPRSREETAEEKKARKTAIKSERKEKRAQKKDLKVRFKLGEVLEHPARR